MTALHFVPYAELERLRNLEAPAGARGRIFANACRLNAISMITYAGSGHVGSTFSSLDIVAWLFLQELQSTKIGDESAGDLYFSSKGHDVPGLYAVLIGMGHLPYESLFALRRLDGLPGHPDISVPSMLANTGSLGMGISKAKGMIYANRLQGQSARVFVMTGDGELQEGQIWESLIGAANSNLSELTVIVDHNKLQSDTWVRDTSDLGDLEAKFAAFGWFTARCDGHDFNALASAFGAMAAADRPRVLIADTIKGRGVSFMEHTAFSSDDGLYRFHSGAPGDADYDNAVVELVGAIDEDLRAIGSVTVELESKQRPPHNQSSNARSLISAYGQALVEQAERNEGIVALDADLVLDTGLIPFRDRFPNRFVECGIAEQDMVSQAGGMALTGLLPVVHSFACFLSARPNEQIYNNATEKKKVIYVGSLAGLVPAGPGHSHQCVRDIASLGGIPGLVLIEPCCEQEVGSALEWAVVRSDASTYLRLVSIPCDTPFTLPADYRLRMGIGHTLVQGQDAIVIGYGPVLLGEACKAAKILAEDNGISVKVINLPWLNRVDDDWLADAVAGPEYVFTLDNHYIAGGQGELVAARLAVLGTKAPSTVVHLGLTDVPACGRNQEVLEFHGLDARGIAAVIADRLDAH